MTTSSQRPRNVNAYQAAAILYGDWGTSKAYVLGLAFALAGYSAFWLIAGICILMTLVAYNYITICKFNPSGGGVYTSARKHSQVLAIIGAFFLMADYFVTISLSALSCFEYLGVSEPLYWAIGSIIFIGIINFFGPRHSGNLALAVCIMAAFMVITLGIISLPYLPQAIQATQWPQGGVVHNWNLFVGMIVALSGIEAIANITGVMPLDSTSTEQTPSVHQTSKKAILLVMTEVCFFTAFFGLMMNALPNLSTLNGEVITLSGLEIRDSMLRYMADYFVSHFWANERMAYFFAYGIGLSFAILLLSAVNTAMVALVSLIFVISRDGEMPAAFQKLTPFGVPRYPLILAMLAPILILIALHDVASLANLYAVGFVGAIALNLGVSAYDKSTPMSKTQRRMMWGTCFIMIVIELSLFVDKPDARRFAISMLTFGLILRAFVVEYRQRQWSTKKVKLKHASLFTDDTRTPLHEGAMLCAVRTIGKTLQFALEEATKYGQPLYILFIREQKILTEEDRNRAWVDDDEACRIFDYAKNKAPTLNLKFFYVVSDVPVRAIIDTATKLKISRLILGRPRYSVMLQILRGNIVQEAAELLPPEIDLLVIS